MLQRKNRRGTAIIGPALLYARYRDGAADSGARDREPRKQLETGAGVFAKLQRVLCKSYWIDQLVYALSCVEIINSRHCFVVLMANV